MAHPYDGESLMRQALMVAAFIAHMTRARSGMSSDEASLRRLALVATNPGVCTNKMDGRRTWQRLMSKQRIGKRMA